MCGGERKYLDEAFAQNWVAPLGPNVDNFEKELASFTGVKHVAALSSGTSAIHLALILLGVGPGDCIAVQSFTFSATVNPIVYQGAIPILVDSERYTWNMDPELLEKSIKDKRQKDKGKRIKAIIAVDLYGMPAKWDEIVAIADKYEIPVICDAAEALGSRYKGKMCGSFGKMGVLSFNGNKIITTSGGGALLSDDVYLIEKARFLATQARDKAPHYQHSQIGYNYRMSNIVAGIGRGQLEVIEQRVEKRRENFEFYKRNLSSIQGVSFIDVPTDDFYPNRWLTTILVNEKNTGASREQIRLELEKENIESRPLWKPMHLQPVFGGHPAYLNGVSEDLFNQGLCLPSGSNITDEERERVVRVIRRTIGEK